MYDLLIKDLNQRPLATGRTKELLLLMNVTDLDPANLIHQGSDYLVGRDDGEGGFNQMECTHKNGTNATFQGEPA